MMLSELGVEVKSSLNSYQSEQTLRCLMDIIWNSALDIVAIVIMILIINFP